MINIANMPAGVYFVRVGENVEKIFKDVKYISKLNYYPGKLL